MSTPSQDIVNGAFPSIALDPDGVGRVITIRKLSPLDKMRLAELAGSDNVKNEVWYGFAMLAYHVTAIDGQPVPRPQSKVALEAVVQRLGDAGLDAVGTGVLKNFIEAGQTEDEARAAIKN